MQMSKKARPCSSLVPPQVPPATGTQGYSLHHTPYTQVHTLGGSTDLCLCPVPLTEGTSGESVSVRPSKSAARLVDTAVGGDTGWTLGGVTVGTDEEYCDGEKQSGIALGWAGSPGLREQTFQHHGQRGSGQAGGSEWIPTLDPSSTPAALSGLKVCSVCSSHSPPPRSKEPRPELPQALLSHCPGHLPRGPSHPNSQSSRSSREISLAAGALLPPGG